MKTYKLEPKKEFVMELAPAGFLLGLEVANWHPNYMIVLFAFLSVRMWHLILFKGVRL